VNHWRQFKNATPRWSRPQLFVRSIAGRIARPYEPGTPPGDIAAVPLLKRAVDLDPDFALAYADLGAAYSNLGQVALSIGAAQKAHDQRQRATEREKLHIDSSYYGLATGELDKEIQVYQQWKTWRRSHNIAAASASSKPAPSCSVEPVKIGLLEFHSRP
jgi:hypothetical protein